MTNNTIITSSYSDNQDNFTNYLIQQLSSEDEKNFALHFKLFLDYGFNNKTFPIDFDDVWKWCEFTRKNDAKKILLKHFKENEDYIFLQQTPQQDLNEENVQKQHGGHNKETIMLNVDTFKEFCMKASTSKAKQIRSYYIKLEKIFFSYTKEQLYYEKDKIKKLETTINNFDIKQNKIYKNVYTNQNIVYIMKLQTFKDNTYVIKIGYTDNIKDRLWKLSSEYSNNENPIIIMDIFPCEYNKKFETFLHNHPYIIKYKYTNLVNDKKSSIETYLIDDNKYEKIKRIVEDNIIYYNGINLEILKEKNKTLELQLKQKELECLKNQPELFKLLCETKQKELDFNNKLYENPELLNKFIELYKNKQNQNITYENNIVETNEIIQEKNEEIIKKQEIKDCGHLVQVYNGNDITKLLHVFNGITDATRNIEGVSFTGVKNACIKKEIYKGYRWHLVNRNDPNPNEVKNIGDTIVPNQKLEGKIAMLDIDLTTVEKVFIKQKDAAEYIGQNVSALCRAINYKIKLSNKYFMFWDMVDKELQDKYLENNTLPLITEKNNGKKVHQINPDTNEIVKVHLSIVDLIRDLKISPRTIKKHSQNDTIYNGFKWKII
jgi:phage anti-repressor protein